MLASTFVLLLLPLLAHGAHIMPLPSREGVHYVDVARLIEVSGTNGVTSSTLEVQLMASLPEWKLKNQEMSDEVFYGQTADGFVTCSLMKEGGIVVGTCVDSSTDPDSWYIIKPNADGEAIVVPTDPTTFPPDGGAAEAPEDERALQEDAEIPSLEVEPTTLDNVEEYDDGRHLQDDESVPGHIDTDIVVLVYWTEEAECKYSGLGTGCTVTDQTFKNIRAQVRAVINEAKMVHSNSGTGVRLVLKRTRDSSGFTENGRLGDTLNRAAVKGDGNMDIIHGVRDARNADLVMVISGDEDICGTAYLFSNPPWSAFSAVSWSCISLMQYYFVAMLGHNMGCLADRGSLQSCASPMKNFGFRTSTFRTVMAAQCFATECDNTGTNDCPRVPYFSGRATLNGISLGGRDNNCRVQVEKTKKDIASYRPKGAIANCGFLPESIRVIPETMQNFFDEAACTMFSFNCF